MVQRVGIARALAHDPEILLMDEPFAALDAQTRELLQEEIKRIWLTTRKTVLWITHSIEEALFLATDIVVMSARPGRIEARFAPVFAQSTDPGLATSAEFVRMKAEIVGLLRDEARAARQQEEARCPPQPRTPAQRGGAARLGLQTYGDPQLSILAYGAPGRGSASA